MKAIFRQILLITFLLPSLSLSAQEEMLHGKLAEYRDLCILERRCVAAKDFDGMADCLARYSDLTIKPFSDGVFKFLQPMKKDALKGHLLFTADYLNQYVEDKLDDISVEGDEHAPRATPNGDIYAVHAVIPARKTCTYEYEGEGRMELLVVCEKEQKLGLKIDVASERIHHQCDNSRADGVRQFSWFMGNESKVRLSITNSGSQSVSVVIASN